MTFGQRVRDHRDRHTFVQQTQFAMCERCGAVQAVDGSNDHETCITYLRRRDAEPSPAPGDAGRSP